MIFLALRYLRERRRQTFLTLLGVFFGTAAYVAVSGFFMGFQGYMVEQLVNNTAQVRIAAREAPLAEHSLDAAFYGRRYARVFWRHPPAGIKGSVTVQNPQSWYARLRADPRVEAFSPLQQAAVLLTLGKFTVSTSLLGCDPMTQVKVTNVADYVVAGRFTDLAVGSSRLALGTELAARLGARLNSVVQVSAGSGPSTPFKIVALVRTGNRDADMAAWSTLADAQRLSRGMNRVNRITVRLKDYWQAAQIAESWSLISPERSESWDQLFMNFLGMFKIQNALRFSMTAAIMIVAGFGIYNVLSMTVNQKRQDIAILRSMGYDSFDVISLFLVQGLILGLAGSVLGLSAGYLFCRWLQNVSFAGLMAADQQGHLSVSLSPWIYVQAAGLALGAASLASVFPARAAAKLTPIEIIRSGG